MTKLKKELMEIIKMSNESQLTDVILNSVFMEDEGLQDRLKSELLKVAEEDSHSSLKSSMLSLGGRLN